MSNNISTTLEFAMSLAAIIDNDEGSMRSDLKCSLVRTENRYGTGSPASRREKRLRHNMPNGSSLATKQLATEKLTWTLATIQMNGTSI